jgi:hypothetical protein
LLNWSGVISGPPAAALALVRDRPCARSLGDAAIADVPRDHRLADQPHGLEQKLDHGLARPRHERLRPIDVGAGIRQLWQDRQHRASLPRLRVESGHADTALGIDLLGRCLLGAGRDPAEQDGGDEPPPFGIVQPSDRSVGRDHAIGVDHLARGSDGGGGCAPLPRVFHG